MLLHNVVLLVIVHFAGYNESALIHDVGETTDEPLLHRIEGHFSAFGFDGVEAVASYADKFLKILVGCFILEDGFANFRIFGIRFAIPGFNSRLQRFAPIACSLNSHWLISFGP